MLARNAQNSQTMKSILANDTKSNHWTLEFHHIQPKGIKTRTKKFALQEIENYTQHNMNFIRGCSSFACICEHFCLLLAALLSSPSVPSCGLSSPARLVQLWVSFPPPPRSNASSPVIWFNIGFLDVTKRFIPSKFFTFVIQSAVFLQRDDIITAT